MYQGEAADQFLLQVLPAVLVAVLVAIPYVRILRRAGRSRWWAAILLIPGFGFFVMPWVVAFMKWKSEPEVAEVFH
jgi:uncharacterized membrane protein YhaH (DUF805 family)